MPKGFEVLGVDTFKAAFAAIPKVLRQELARAVNETVIQIRNTAAVHVARDRGDLSRAIVIVGKPTALTQRVGIRDADVPGRGGKNSYHRNPSVYGMAVEYGLKHRKYSAQPFLRPAAERGVAFYQAALARARTRLEGELASFNTGSAA